MITSASNPTLKLVRKLLAQKRKREELGLFAVEGEDLVAAAAAAGSSRSSSSSPARPSSRSCSPGLDARAPGARRRALPTAALPREPRETTLALWRVADPGNVGTLLRAADAFGAAVALSAGCADPLGPKALRASAGAIFRVPLLAFDEAPGRARRPRRPRRAALHELDLSGPVTFVLGAERDGLPAEVVDGRDAVATIATPRARPSRSTWPSRARSRSTSARGASRAPSRNQRTAALPRSPATSWPPRKRR